MHTSLAPKVLCPERLCPRLPAGEARRHVCELVLAAARPSDPHLDDIHHGGESNHASDARLSTTRCPRTCNSAGVVARACGSCVRVRACVLSVVCVHAWRSRVRVVSAGVLCVRAW